MNKQIEALKMAIEWKNSNKYTAEQVIEACKEALEQPSWQGLDAVEVSNIFISKEVNGDATQFARAIEQALKEKNHAKR